MTTVIVKTCEACSEHPRRGRPAGGKFVWSEPVKKENADMFMEVDEQNTASLPVPMVDDDGDPVGPVTVEWTSSAPEILVLPSADGMSAIVRATGVTVQGTISAKVSVADGGYGIFTGAVTIGLGVPVGGELGFGTPEKITP